MENPRETTDASALLETKNAPILRERMRERGITITAFAREAGDYKQSVSGYFLGREYVGAKRRARWGNAIIRLGLDQPAPATPDAGEETAAEKPRPEPRIRRL